MKIESGLLYIKGFTFSEVDLAAVAESDVCVPVRNISHFAEFSHEGKVFTVIHLNNGGEITVSCSTHDLIQTITESGSMSLFGSVGTARFPNPEVVINGSELKVLLKRVANRMEDTLRFPKGGVVYNPDVNAIV